MEQAGAGAATAFGVELHAVVVVPGEGGGEGDAVVAGGDGGGAFEDGVAVHEVVVAVRRDVGKERVAGRGVDTVPAHMRQRQVMRGQARGLAGDEAEGGEVAFGGMRGEELHAEADAEQWLGCALDNGDEAARGEVGHGGARRADAGQEQFVGSMNGGGFGADVGVDAQAF